MDEIEEIEFRVKDSTQRAVQLEQKITELRRTEKYTEQRHFKFTDRFIMQGSILSVHVIDARDLVPALGRNFANAQITLSIEGESRRTEPVAATNDPVWDQVLIMDIKEGTDPLKLTVQDVGNDRSRTRIGYCEIPLSSLSEEPGEIDQIKFDKLYDLGNGRSTVRIAVQWIYSTVKLLEDILQQVREQTQNDQDQLTVFKNDIAAMRNPFETFVKGGELMLYRE